SAISAESVASSDKTTEAQEQSTTKDISTDVKNATTETEVKTETKVAEKAEKDLTVADPNAATEKTAIEDTTAKK
ncbi:hypothetical protein, partial [Streptomyces scabiei]|uniref:hypothetical protein n=1 Tax=Streptomyces scabiei TaxID=1930 RepID=UPI0038F705A1